MYLQGSAAVPESGGGDPGQPGLRGLRRRRGGYAWQRERGGSNVSAFVVLVVFWILICIYPLWIRIHYFRGMCHSVDKVDTHCKEREVDPA